MGQRVELGDEAEEDEEVAEGDIVTELDKVDEDGEEEVGEVEEVEEEEEAVAVHAAATLSLAVGSVSAARAFLRGLLAACCVCRPPFFLGMLCVRLANAGGAQRT